MARRSQLPEASAGDGGRLARASSTLGMQQRAGILATKSQQPLLSDAEIAAMYGVSAASVRQLLASVTTDAQPLLRTYAVDAAELYWQAVQQAAADGDYKGPQEFLRDASAMPDRSKNAGGAGLNVTVIVSAPPGTPQFLAHQAPPLLDLEVTAGPQVALAPIEPRDAAPSTD